MGQRTAAAGPIAPNRSVKMAAAQRPRLSSVAMVKVGINIPTYNRCDLLRSAIASVRDQTFTDWKLVVADDGSTDGTAAMMADLTAADPRIHYLRHPTNIGKSNNMRSGFEAAIADYFIKFDDDDRLTPDFLAQTTAILDHHPQIDFVGTDHWIIDLHGDRDPAESDRNTQHWGRHHLPAGPVENLLAIVFEQQSFQVGATLFRRAALDDVGYMLPDVQNCEDNDLFVRLALGKKRGYYLPNRLMEYRRHPGQQGIHREIPYLQDKLQYLSRYRFDDPRLEALRQERIADCQLSLGIRAIAQGDTGKGQALLLAGWRASKRRAAAGLLLSVLPAPIRDKLLQLRRDR